MISPSIFKKPYDMTGSLVKSRAFYSPGGGYFKGSGYSFIYISQANQSLKQSK